MIDEEVLRLLEGALKQARDVMHTYRNKIDAVVNVLLEKEVIEKEEFEENYKNRLRQSNNNN